MVASRFSILLNLGTIIKELSMVDIANSFELGGTPTYGDDHEVDEIQRRAAEATTDANVDPSLLTPEQHREVTAVQTLAGRAVIEANLAILDAPEQAAQ
jgi:hypothetical protein